MAEFPKWQFFTPSQTDTVSIPNQYEHFNVVPSDLTALIRESMQNSLDQSRKTGGLVRARILTSQHRGLTRPQFEPYFQDLWPHADATGRSISDEDCCHFLVVEDFDTTGLTGNPRTNVPLEGADNHFVYFFRMEGVGKNSGPGASDTLGRRGVGKVVFWEASELSLVMGYTVRESDDYDMGAGLLMGKARMHMPTLGHHQLEGRWYSADGWWGRGPTDGGPVEPLVETSLIDRFRADWHLARKPAEPGLSVVVPFVKEPWTVSEIRDAVVRDYFLPIFRGRLSVLVENLDGGSEVIDASTLERHVAELADEPARVRIGKDLEALKWAAGVEPARLPISFAAGPSWATAELDQEGLKELTSRLTNDGRVYVRVPIKVKTTPQVRKLDKVDGEGFLDLLVSFEESVNERPLFVRRGIVVSEVQTSRISGYRVLALVEDSILSRMLGDAEGPAHTTWTSREKQFRGKYEEGRDWLAVVKRSPAQAVRLLTGRDDDADRTLAEEFFSEATEGAGETAVTEHGQDEGHEKEPPGVPKKLQRHPAGLAVTRRASGFVITNNTARDAAVVESATIAVGYSLRRGDAIRNWTPLDFTLGDGGDLAVAVAVHGATYWVDGNSIVLSDIHPTDLKVELSGFDENRDVDIVIREAGAKAEQV